MAEEVLGGGNLNQTVRVGTTVRRTTGFWTPAVHELLRHLEARGFEAAPRTRGLDDQAREILTYISGETDSSGDPAWVWTAAALVEAVRLIRRYHDVCLDFRPSTDVTWQAMVGAPTTGEIICHNDLAPYNTIYRDGLPVAFIDWDLAAPGPPLWDLAHAAWRFIPLYSDSSGRGWPSDLGVRVERLQLLCDVYGLDPAGREGLVNMIERRMLCGLDTGRAWAGRPGWAQLSQQDSHADGTRRDLDYISRHRETFHRACIDPR